MPLYPHDDGDSKQCKNCRAFDPDRPSNCPVAELEDLRLAIKTFAVICSDPNKIAEKLVELNKKHSA